MLDVGTVGYIEDETLKNRDDETACVGIVKHRRSRRWSRQLAHERVTQIPTSHVHRLRIKVHHALNIEASSSTLEASSSSASRRRRDHSRPSLPNASAFHIAPTMRHANPTYVHIRKIHPTTLRHRASACSHPSRYMCDPRVHAPSSCNTCRTGSAHSNGTLTPVSALGPYRIHTLPRLDRARRAVAIATPPLANRFTPSDASCENRFAPALAAAPVSDAASNGQHHDPTSAGALAITAHVTASAPERARRLVVIPSASTSSRAVPSTHASHRSRSDPYDGVGETLRERSSSGARADARIAHATRRRVPLDRSIEMK